MRSLRRCNEKNTKLPLNADKIKNRNQTHNLTNMATTKPSWPDQNHRLFRSQRVRQVAYVPDFGHSRLIELVRSDRQMRAVPLTTEEEGVALVTGAWLGRARRSADAIERVGNCINMLGMIQECRIPLLMLVTMRRQWGEFNPWQVPMAQATAPVLAAMRGGGATVERRRRSWNRGGRGRLQRTSARRSRGSPRSPPACRPRSGARQALAPRTG